MRPNPKSHIITYNSCCYRTNQPIADQQHRGGSALLLIQNIPSWPSYVEAIFSIHNFNLHLAEGKVQRRALVTTEMNLWFPLKAKNFSAL
jgi:hypothetical protein